jgi:hypothetical protein
LKNRQIGISITKFGIQKKINVGTQYTSFCTRKTVAAIPTDNQNDCRHTYIYSTPVATIPTSTQRWLPPYLHLLKTVAAIPTSTQRWSRHTYIYSMPVAAIPTSTQKKGRNVFWFMKLEELVAGEDSKLAGTCSKLAGTHFMIEKIKFRWKFQSSKGPELE